MKTHYQTLGINPNANADEIKAAYRRLAGQHHPDRGGNTQLFQEIQNAYSVIGDTKKRAEYDNPGMHMHHGPGGQQPFNFESIFDIFGTRFGHGQPQARSQARMSLWITLVDVATGGSKAVSIGTQHGVHTVDIEIPRGINDGDSVQYPGMAPGGGDLVIQFRIHGNPGWQRQELNLLTEQSISVWDCILGTEIVIKDLTGNQLKLTIPPKTQPGTLLRLKGRGLAHQHGSTGDLLIRVMATIPSSIDPDLLTLIEQKRQQ
jgi:DnaJ-class molecular chaperone